MVQNIIALAIVAVVLLKVVYSVYKSLITKEKSLCGGCASCDLKNELKKRGKLTSQMEEKQIQKVQFSAGDLKYSGRS